MLEFALAFFVTLETSAPQVSASPAASHIEAPAGGEADAKLGKAILACLHPTGKFTYAAFGTMTTRSDGISEMDGTIKWSGAITDASYKTEVIVQVRKVNGAKEWRVKVTGETSIVPYNKNCRLLAWNEVD